MNFYRTSMIPCFVRCYTTIMLCMALMASLAVYNLSAQQIIRLLPQQSVYAIGLETSSFLDNTRSLSLADVMSTAYTEQFRPNTVLHPNWGATSAAVWVRFTVRNTAPAPVDWLLDAGYTDSTTLYCVHRGGVYHTLYAGKAVALANRAYPVPRTVFPLDIPQDSIQTFYLRVVSPLATRLELTVYEQKHFTRKQSGEDMFYGIIYGVFIFAVLYNLVLFVRLRQMVYLYYGLYVTLAGFSYAVFEGLFAQYYWVNISFFDVRLAHTVQLCAVAMGALFVRTLLHLKNSSPKADRVVQGLAVICLLGVGWAMSQTETVLPDALTGLASLVFISIGVLSWRKGYRPAGIYLLGWSFYIAAVLYGMATTAISSLPYHDFWSFKIIYIGAALEVILFSFALAEHVLLVQTELTEERTRNDIAKMEYEFKLEQTSRERELEHLRNVELAAANTQLQHLNNEKNELMQIVAHDLKSPLTGIQGIAEMMQHEPFQPAEYVEMSHVIHDSAQQMFGIVRNLLDSNALETGQMPMEMTDVDMNAVVRNSAQFHAQTAQAKLIRFALQTADTDTTVHVDKQALVQIVDNILSNAVKYSPNNTTVSVRVFRKEEVVRLEVQDEGPGISDDDRKKLFQKFARLSAKPTGGEHSTGLGLSIVKKLIDAMQGRVWCESFAGKGATFIVELPRNTTSVL